MSRALRESKAEIQARIVDDSYDLVSEDETYQRMPT